MLNCKKLKIRFCIVYIFSELFTTHTDDIVGSDNHDMNTMALTMYRDVSWEIWCEMEKKW